MESSMKQEADQVQSVVAIGTPGTRYLKMIMQSQFLVALPLKYKSRSSHSFSQPLLQPGEIIYWTWQNNTLEKLPLALHSGLPLILNQEHIANNSSKSQFPRPSSILPLLFITVNRIKTRTLWKVGCALRKFCIEQVRPRFCFFTTHVRIWITMGCGMNCKFANLSKTILNSWQQHCMWY